MPFVRSDCVLDDVDRTDGERKARSFDDARGGRDVDPGVSSQSSHTRVGEVALGAGFSLLRPSIGINNERRLCSLPFTTGRGDVRLCGMGAARKRCITSRPRFPSDPSLLLLPGALRISHSIAEAEAEIVAFSACSAISDKSDVLAFAVSEDSGGDKFGLRCVVSGGCDGDAGLVSVPGGTLSGDDLMDGDVAPGTAEVLGHE